MEDWLLRVASLSCSREQKLRSKYYNIEQVVAGDTHTNSQSINISEESTRMTQVVLGENEGIESALRRFKRQVSKAGY
jgi:hypothetical protein